MPASLLGEPAAKLTGQLRYAVLAGGLANGKPVPWVHHCAA